MIKTFADLSQISEKCISCLNAKFDGSDGKRHVVMCGGTGCLSSHSDKIRERMAELVKEKGLDDKVTVNQVGCFGLCSQLQTLLCLLPLLMDFLPRALRLPWRLLATSPGHASRLACCSLNPFSGSPSRL